MTGVVRRRRWSDEEKRALVAEAFAPGAVMADVALRADVHSGQIYRWRKELQMPPLGFAPVVVSSPTPTGVLSDGPAATIDVAAGDGARVRLPVSVSPELAAAIIKAVVGR
jgi:transposase